MRLLTWNLWWRFGPWEERAGAIENVLAAQRADVLFLQEVRVGDGQAQRLADELDLSAAICDREQDMGNAIVSRWPIIESDVRQLPGSADRPSVRRALHAVVDSPWGPWPVVCTHLAHRFDESAIRLAQVDALADLVAEIRTRHQLPVLLGGDFNAVPDSDEIRRLTGRTAVRRPDLVFADMWELQGSGSGHTWSGSNPYLSEANWPNRRIDYLFVTWPRPKPAGHPRRVWLAGTEPVGGIQPSDHFAVVADIATPTEDQK